MRGRVDIGRRAAVGAAAVLALLWAAAAAQDVRVTAGLNTTSTAVGRGVTLTVEITGAQDVQPPAIEAPQGLAVRYSGPTTQFSFVNGVSTSSVSHRYSVIASSPGDYTIGPIVVEHAGRSYDAGTVSLHVAAAPAAPRPRARQGGSAAADDVSLLLEVPKERLYLHERVPVTVTLVVGNTRVSELRSLDLSSDGFAVDPFPQGRQSTEIRDGRRVQVVRFQTTVVPLRSGPLTLGPALMKVMVQVQRRGGRGFFDSFFAETAPREIQSDEVGVRVEPLPDEGRPGDFRGAVGRFDLDVSAEPRELDAGDPITVRIRISGRGNLDLIEPPPLAVGDVFKTYPPQVSTDADGSRIFEQVLIPLDETAREVPAVRLSFFDPDAGRYQTAVEGPFPLVVHPAAAAAREPRVVQQAAPGAVPRPAEELGRDIVYIKDSPGTLRPRGTRFYAASWFLLLQLLPLLAYAGCRWYAQRQQRLRTDPAYARFARAGAEVRRVLEECRRELRSGGVERFDDRLSRGVREYLSAKLALPVGAVDGAHCARRLRERGLDEAVAAEVERLFQLIEGGRYTPGALADGEREAALEAADLVVRQLERRSAALERRLGTAVLLALVLVAAARAEAPNPHAAFYAGNTAYSEGRLDDAVRDYEDVLAAGWESPAVHYNLGNAHMRAGEVGRAILSYERARRLAPRDADILANLRFARAERGLEVDTPLWRRLLLPLAERAATGELAASCAVLYWLMMAALCWRALHAASARVAGRVAGVTLVALVVAFASLAARLQRYELATSAVVVAGEVAARFEPSADGTAHFTAVEGTVVRVLEERDDWLLVVRDDGRRGWIPHPALAEI